MKKFKKYDAFRVRETKIYNFRDRGLKKKDL